MAKHKTASQNGGAQPGRAEHSALSSPRRYGTGPGDRAANMQELLAIKKYQRAIERNPVDAEAHFNLGVLYFAREKGEEAMGLFTKALELRPDYPEAHLLLGMEHHYRGQFDEAIDRYHTALQLKPEDPAPYRLLALAFDALGNQEAAHHAQARAEELAGNAVAVG